MSCANTSSTGGSSAKTTYIPIFTGKDKDYGVWWPRFRSFTVIKEFGDALEENSNLPADPEVLSTDLVTLAEQKKAIKENTLAPTATTGPLFHFRGGTNSYVCTSEVLTNPGACPWQFPAPT